MAQKLYEESNIQAIADAIRTKNGTTNTYKTSDMASAIVAIEGGDGGVPTSALTITGNCQYMFAQDSWNWFIELYGDKITTQDVTDLYYFLYMTKDIDKIPFELNCKSNYDFNLQNVFAYAQGLTEVPKINNCRPSGLKEMFRGCSRLREVPEDIGDWFDWTTIDNPTSQYTGSMSGMFSECLSLRSIPMSMFKHTNKYANSSYTYYWQLASRDYCLDEIVNLPISYPSDQAKTTNMFNSCISDCYRLKNFTFAMQDDGTPYVMPWSNQTIEFTSNVGWTGTYSIGYMTDYNSGIPEGKRVIDAETYQALKDDPDWWTTNLSYSRYNHDSAVATINSLPDCSAYIAENGGTNSLKFKGAAGELTDGGAINTLTEEEVKVANDKGWTIYVDNVVFTGYTEPVVGGNGSDVLPS